MHASMRVCECNGCEFRGCQDVRVATFEYCRSHKCVVPECHRQRRPSSMAVGVRMEMLFCDGHGCGHSGCCNRVMDGSRLCFDHAVTGCRSGGGLRMGMGMEVEEEDDGGCRGHRMKMGYERHGGRHGGCGGSRSACAALESGCRG